MQPEHWDLLPSGMISGLCLAQPFLDMHLGQWHRHDNDGNANGKSTLPDNVGNDNDNGGNDTGNDTPGNDNNNPWTRSGAHWPVQCHWHLAEHWSAQRHWQLAQHWTDPMSIESPLALSLSAS